MNKDYQRLGSREIEQLLHKLEATKNSNKPFKFNNNNNMYKNAYYYVLLFIFNGLPYPIIVNTNMTASKFSETIKNILEKHDLHLTYNVKSFFSGMCFLLSSGHQNSNMATDVDVQTFKQYLQQSFGHSMHVSFEPLLNGGINDIVNMTLHDCSKSGNKDFSVYLATLLLVHYHNMTEKDAYEIVRNTNQTCDCINHNRLQQEKQEEELNKIRKMAEQLEKEEKEKEEQASLLFISNLQYKERRKEEKEREDQASLLLIKQLEEERKKQDEDKSLREAQRLELLQLQEKTDEEYARTLQ